MSKTTRTTKKYPVDVRQRTVWLVFEHRGEHANEWAAITSIAQTFAMTAETLRKWMRQAEVDGRSRPGLSTAKLSGSRSWSGRSTSCCGRRS